MGLSNPKLTCVDTGLWIGAKAMAYLTGKWRANFRQAEWERHDWLSDLYDRPERMTGVICWNGLISQDIGFVLKYWDVFIWYYRINMTLEELMAWPVYDVINEETEKGWRKADYLYCGFDTTADLHIGSWPIITGGIYVLILSNRFIGGGTVCGRSFRKKTELWMMKKRSANGVLSESKSILPVDKTAFAWFSTNGRRMTPGPASWLRPPFQRQWWSRRKRQIAAGRRSHHWILLHDAEHRLSEIYQHPGQLRNADRARTNGNASGVDLIHRRPGS